jgi:hypothetical protein
MGDMLVVQGAGYGGGSLIYANVQIRPPADVFDEGWPSWYSRAALDPYYDLVGYMLDIAPVGEDPATGELPPKTRVIKYALGGFDGGVADVLVDIGYDVVVLLVTFGLFVLVLRSTANRAIRGAAARLGGDDADPERLDATVDEIRRRLEGGPPPPLGDDLRGEIAVFASGHTHAPSLVGFDTSTGARGAAVNSGCWLRQAHPVRARLKAPSVFVSRFVLTHARVRRGAAGIEVELWEHPRRCEPDLLTVERLAVAGRLPAEPDDDASPRIRARATIGRAAASRPPEGARA